MSGYKLIKMPKMAVYHIMRNGKIVGTIAQKVSHPKLWYVMSGEHERPLIAYDEPTCKAAFDEFKKYILTATINTARLEKQKARARRRK